jgi:hypothetical protein
VASTDGIIADYLPLAQEFLDRTATHHERDAGY